MDALSKIEVLNVMLHCFDDETYHHQLRTATICKRFATILGMSEESIGNLYVAAMVHDIGKFAFPKQIFINNHKLESYEFEFLKNHCQVGCNLLQEMKFDPLTCRIALEHHENLNGTGYPNRLQEDDILYESKILRIVDSVDAMLHRCYSVLHGDPDRLNKALSEIWKLSGIYYDPILAEQFITAVHSEKLILLGD